jgi:hypothetical protein
MKNLFVEDVLTVSKEDRGNLDNMSWGESRKPFDTRCFVRSLRISRGTDQAEAVIGKIFEIEMQ